MANMFSANQSANQAAGESAGSTRFSGRSVDFARPANVANRAQARLLKEQSDQALRETKATRKTDKDLEAMSELQSEEIELGLQQARAANVQLSRQHLYSGFDRFETDGNLRHLNQSLQELRNNPVGRNLPGFSDITRFQHITSEDAKLLEPYGLTPEQFQENPELKQFMVKAVTQNGEERVIPTEALYAGTGYNHYATDRSLTEQERRAQIVQMMQARNVSQASKSERIAARMTDADRPADIPEEEWQDGHPEYNEAFLKNLREAETLGQNESMTEDEGEAARMTNLQRPEGVAEEDWQAGNSEYDQAYQRNFEAVKARDARTSNMKELSEVEQAKATVDQTAKESGADSFFELDMSEPSNRYKFEPHIQRIERLGELSFSEAEKKDITYLRELINLGGPASEITEDEVGLIDRALHNVSKYIRQDTSGIDYTSSRAAFRNIMRRAMSGQTLTSNEESAFNQAFGTDGQKLGPVLEQFRTALTRTRSQLESVMNLNDSYVSHFYLGADRTQLYQTIDALEERIDLVDKTAEAEGITINPDEAAATREANRAQSAETGAGNGESVTAQPLQQDQVNAQLDDIWNSTFGE